MTAMLPPPIVPLAGRQTAAFTVAAAFLFGCLLSFAVFSGAWAAMLHVWSTSETFAHGYIVLPCTAWMLWQRRSDWRNLAPRLWWPGYLALAGCGFAWLVGHLAGVNSVEQIAAVSVIPAAVLLWAGPAIARAVALPLIFLFFAVPIGEFLTPVMMQYTADATVMAIRWSGIPVFREGLHFSLPSGRWSVVEACSGLRYLIASVALGVIYAYLQFRSWRYRLVIIALAIVVPVFANWIRAYGIVMLGHLSGMKIATGVDHLIYGWLFFGLVMAVFFWLGSLWKEPEAKPETAPVRAIENVPDESGRSPASRRVLIQAFIAVALILVWRPVAGYLLERTAPDDAIGSLRAALEAAPQAEETGFSPRFEDAVNSLHATQRVDGGIVETFIFHYARQRETGELIQHGNQVVRADDQSAQILTRGVHPASWGKVATWRIRRDDGQVLLVWQWYAVADWQLASPYLAKAATAWSLLTGRGDESLAVVLVSPLNAADGGTLEERAQAASRRLGAMADRLQTGIRAVVDPV